MVVVVILVVVLRLSSGKGSGIRRYWQMLMLFCSWLVEEHLQPCKLGPMSPLAPPPLPGGIPGGWPLWGDVEIPVSPNRFGIHLRRQRPRKRFGHGAKESEEKGNEEKGGHKDKETIGQVRNGDNEQDEEQR